MLHKKIIFAYDLTVVFSQSAKKIINHLEIILKKRYSSCFQHVVVQTQLFIDKRGERTSGLSHCDRIESFRGKTPLGTQPNVGTKPH